MIILKARLHQRVDQASALLVLELTATSALTSTALDWLARLVWSSKMWVNQKGFIFGGGVQALRCPSGLCSEAQILRAWSFCSQWARVCHHLGLRTPIDPFVGATMPNKRKRFRRGIIGKYSLGV